MKPEDRFVDITLHDNVTITTEGSRAFLARVGIEGQIVHTPGHSDDSMSLLLDSGIVFTGDLTHPALATEETAAEVARSWARLRDLGATTVYPGHGPPRVL
jgi:glyoxylase-like metal-dependent hydrolase (beta-lactamase superfamily II)